MSEFNLNEEEIAALKEAAGQFNHSRFWSWLYWRIQQPFHKRRLAALRAICNPVAPSLRPAEKFTFEDYAREKNDLGKEYLQDVAYIEAARQSLRETFEQDMADLERRRIEAGITWQTTEQPHRQVWPTEEVAP